MSNKPQMKQVRVKEPFGMLYSFFFPIISTPANAHPTYGPGIDMGAAVKAAFNPTFADAELYGDDELQLDGHEFVGGEITGETLLDELAIDAQLFGHRFEGGVLSENKDDVATPGAYAYVRKLRTKTGVVYRPYFYYNVTPRKGGENVEGKGSSVTFTNKAMTYKLMPDATGDYRAVTDCASAEEALEFIQGVADAATGGAFVLTLVHAGKGSSTPGAGVSFVAKGEKAAVTFAADPTALYDGNVDVTDRIADHTYTIASMAADHTLTAIF
ncbi:MAG: hypothetical protein IJV41_00715 [Oscillospiraceae bacterium]|nr:hypothetical protein [Oscillospiraceae bacterium]